MDSPLREGSYLWGNLIDNDGSTVGKIRVRPGQGNTAISSIQNAGEEWWLLQISASVISILLFQGLPSDTSIFTYPYGASERSGPLGASWGVLERLGAKTHFK